MASRFAGGGGGARLMTPRDMRLFHEHCRKLAKVFQRAAEHPQPGAGVAATLCGDLGLLLADGAAQAERVIRDEGVMGPRFTFLSRHGVQGVIALQEMPEAGQQKVEMTAAMATLVQYGPVDAYVVAMEAWVAAYEAGPDGKTLPGPDPVDRPDRREVVMVTAANRSGSVARSFGMERDTAGRFLRLTPMDGAELAEVPEGSKATGAKVRAINPMLSNLFELADRVTLAAANFHPGTPGKAH